MAGRPDDAAARAPERPGGVATRHDPGELKMRSRLMGNLFGGPAAPVRVGRYVVLEEIGSGGLGVVYSAYDPELDRKVALKLLNPARLSPRAAARMQREAQAMARVTHPNVVAVHDAGPHGDGVFIAMELVDGMTLSAWKAQGRHKWTVVRDVLVSAGHGLDAAHRQGLVHRDFKPANVLVDTQGRARVLDFGLARAAESADETPGTPQQLLSVDLTQTGTVLGTPAYMAPEQFEGHADARSDQWGFCVTAYEMLYGGRPFGGMDANGMRDAVRAGKIPSPHAGSSVPSWLYRALTRGMSVSPAERHSSMQALLGAMQRDKRSRRMQIAGVALTVLLSSAGTAAGLWATRPEPSQQSREAVQQLEEGAREAAEAGWYVYPSADDPGAPTALVSVIALEQLEGPIGPEAKALASTLRSEFADSLVTLGDSYWDAEAGAPFAADFYAAALLFDPETKRARERSTLTPGELSALRSKATNAGFTDSEVVGAAPLAALAEPNPDRRTEKVRKLLARKRTPADSTTRRLGKLVGASTPSTVSAPPRSEAGRGVPKAAPPAKKTVEAQKGGGAANAEPRDKPKRDPGEAKAEAKAGRAALRRGSYGVAEKAFHRALAKDGRNETALAGLSEIYFERGAYQKALSYAKKAAGVAPKRGSIRMQLGDAYFKVHRYDAARKEYETAKKLGAKGAARALERVESRIGSG